MTLASDPDTNDIAPRVGVVWTPVERLALRAGFGIFYQQFDRYGSESQLGLNLPQLVDASMALGLVEVSRTGVAAIGRGPEGM